MSKKDIIKDEETSIYELFFENIIYPSLIISPDGSIFKSNKCTEKLTGISNERIIGKNCCKIFHDFEKTPKNCPCKAVLSGKKDIYSFELKTKTGHYKIDCIPVEQLEHEKVQILLVAVDITDQKKLEQFYKTVFENTGAATVIIEEDMKLSLVNHTFEKLSGFSKHEIEGKKKWTEFVTKKDLDRMKKYHDNRRKKRGAPNTYEFDVKDRKGKIKHVLMTIDLIPGTKKTVGSIVDLTDQKIAEEKYRNFFNKSPLLMAEADKEGNILSLNPAMTRSLGIKSTELKRKNIRNTIKDRIFEERKKKAKEAIEKNKVISFEDYRKDRFFLNHFIPLVKDIDERILIYAIDITERKKMELSLRESEKSYRELFNNIPDAVIVHDINSFKVIDANKEAFRRFKLNEENFIEFEVEDFSFISKGFTREKALTYLNNVVKNKKQVFEWLSRTSDGIPIWHEMNLRLVDINGKKRIIAIARDITDRKKLQQKTRESEEKYRTLFEKATDSILLLKGTTILDCNIQFINLIGRDRERIVGSQLFDFSPEYQSDSQLSKKKFTQKMNQCLSENLKSFEFNLTRADGKRVCVSVSCGLVNFGGKNFTLLILHDITEHKKNEMQIIKTQSYLKNLIDSTSEIIIAINTKRKITTWSKSAVKLTGFLKKEIINRKIDSLKIFKNYEKIDNIVDNICNRRKIHSNILHIYTSDRELKILKFSASRLIDNKNECIGAIFICKDITEDSNAIEFLQRGNRYLIRDSSTKYLYSLVSIFRENKYEVLFITRPNKRILNDSEYNKKNTNFLFLNDENIENFKTANNVNEILRQILVFLKKDNNRKIIILDRIDFLLMNHSIKDFFKFIYKTNSMILKTNTIFLVNIDPSTVSEMELSIIKKEFEIFPEQDEELIHLKKEMIKIINYVFEKEQEVEPVNFKKIGKELSISHSTVTKRIASLQRKGLIHVEKKGREKIIFLTTAGRKIAKNTKFEKLN